MDEATITRTHAARALIELRQRILGGVIPGGTRLLEVPLAEDLQISRTPVREAMSRLAEEGLLDRAPGGGFVVRSFAYADVLDTIELRGVLEGMAARMAAERGVSGEALAPAWGLVDELDLCFSADGHGIDFERYSDLNARFHQCLATLSNSAVIEREIDRVTRLPFASPSTFVPDHARIDAFRRSLITAQDQHRALIEAIAAREGARAEAIAREHSRAARRNVAFLFHEAPGVASLALITG